jgi:hypothetical protein
VEQTVVQKAINHICHILVVQLNYFSDEDLQTAQLNQSLTFLTIPKILLIQVKRFTCSCTPAPFGVCRNKEIKT